MLAELFVPRLAIAFFGLASPFGAPVGQFHLVPTRALVALCSHDDGSMEHTSESADGRSRWHVRWSGNHCTLDIRSTGKATFNSTFTDIVSIAGDGTLDITDVDGGTTRSLGFTSDRSGGLVRKWSINGQTKPWDDAGRRWLADLLVELDRVTADGVDYRYPSLLAAGGPRAVLDEVERMHGDYARSVYLRRLVDSQKLSDAEYQRVVAIAARDISSDYETSRVLRAVAEHASLDNAAMRASYLAAVAHMSSDYERSRVLMTLLGSPTTTREVATAAVRSAKTFSSDYERSRVLLAAIESKALDVDDVIPVLETVSRSSSDYEKSRVMLAVAGKWTLNGDARKAYLRAADSIRSDYENRRVLAALIKQEAR